MFDRRLSPRYYDSIVRACLEAGFSPKISHQSTSILSQIGIVACGLAVTLVPESMQRLQMPSVVFRELAKAVSLTDIALVWQPRADAELIGSFVAATKELFPDGAA